MSRLVIALLLGSLTVAAPGKPLPIPRAIYTDPVRDAKYPAAMEVLHIPSGKVRINAVAYLAAGKGPRPTLVILHGLPGNEKNLDLAQAVRRAGWNAVTFNYRGSWGSPGSFRFANNLEDARAVLAYLRSDAVAAGLGIDTKKIVIGGHSMGGWVAAMTGGADSAVAGTILISAADMARSRGTREQAVAAMAENMESLADTSPAMMIDELERERARFDWSASAAGLARRPLLMLNSDDGLAPAATALAAKVRAAKGQVRVVHVATDHGWSDRRIRLQSEVIRWLESLGK
ncbi:MAG: alpha/beta hydrolase family protein [Sphingomicrobium sp.]